MLLTWRWFPAACTLAVGLMLKLGAPFAPIVLGLVAAAAVTWRSRTSDRSG